MSNEQDGQERKLSVYFPKTGPNPAPPTLPYDDDDKEEMQKFLAEEDGVRSAP